MRSAGYSDSYPEAVPALELWAIADKAATTCGTQHGPELSRCLDDVLGQYLCPCLRDNSLIWQAVGHEFIARMHTGDNEDAKRRI